MGQKAEEEKVSKPVPVLIRGGFDMTKDDFERQAAIVAALYYGPFLELCVIDGPVD